MDLIFYCISLIIKISVTITQKNHTTQCNNIVSSASNVHDTVLPASVCGCSKKCNSNMQCMSIDVYKLPLSQSLQMVQLEAPCGGWQSNEDPRVIFLLSFTHLDVSFI